MKSCKTKAFHSRKILHILVKKAIIYEKGAEFMRTFNYKKLKNEKWDSEIISYIAKIYQEQGKQEQYR